MRFIFIEKGNDLTRKDLNDEPMIFLYFQNYLT